MVKKKKKVVKKKSSLSKKKKIAKKKVSLKNSKTRNAKNSKSKINKKPKKSVTKKIPKKVKSKIVKEVKPKKIPKSISGFDEKIKEIFEKLINKYKIVEQVQHLHSSTSKDCRNTLLCQEDTWRISWAQTPTRCHHGIFSGAIPARVTLQYCTVRYWFQGMVQL